MQFTGNQTFTSPQVSFNALTGIVELANNVQLNVNGNVTANASNFFGNPANIVSTGTKTLNLSGAGTPFGTIANPNGDVVLTPGLLINTAGKSLVILAEGNVIGQGLGLINLKSTTGPGGALSVLAGFAFTPAPSGTPDRSIVFTVTGPSASGGVSIFAIHR
jgi:hypothetical protein